jgi:hypothetical protein
LLLWRRKRWKGVVVEELEYAMVALVEDEGLVLIPL